jgi:ABC-type antimicrobial peptide transport system permease subunit
MRTFLAGVSPYDPAAFAAGALLLAAAGLAAAYVPARQASRVDPIRALRSGIF